MTTPSHRVCRPCVNRREVMDHRRRRAEFGCVKVRCYICWPPPRWCSAGDAPNIFASVRPVAHRGMAYYAHNGTCSQCYHRYRE